MLAGAAACPVPGTSGATDARTDGPADAAGATGHDGSSSANQAPQVDAGPDVTLALPTDEATLTGAASDPDGTIASLAWTRQSGPAATMSGQATATLHLGGLVAGTYVFRLTATDDDGATAFDEVQVTVAPAPTTVCGTADEWSPYPTMGSITLTCPAGQTIEDVVFASYGTPTGSCGSFAASSCHASTTVAVVEAQCLGKSSCTLTDFNALFSDPCSGTAKRLSVEVVCGGAPRPDGGTPAAPRTPAPATPGATTAGRPSRSPSRRSP